MFSCPVGAFRPAHDAAGSPRTRFHDVPRPLDSLRGFLAHARAREPAFAAAGASKSEMPLFNTDHVHSARVTASTTALRTATFCDALDAPRAISWRF